MNKEDLIKQLCNIVKSNSVSELHSFKSSHPEITLFETVTEGCICGCAEKTCAANKLNMNFITRDFIDALFDLGYITSANILLNIFRYMTCYEEWDNVNYFISKFDNETLRSCYSLMEAGTSSEYTDDPLSAFYMGCHVTHYWGKVHPGARECYERLTAAGCIARHSSPHFNDLKAHFMDDSYHIKWQEDNNTESFHEFKLSPSYSEWLKI